MSVEFVGEAQIHRTACEFKALTLYIYHAICQHVVTTSRHVVVSSDHPMLPMYCPVLLALHPLSETPLGMNPTTVEVRMQYIARLKVLQMCKSACHSQSVSRDDLSQDTFLSTDKSHSHPAQPTI